MDIPVVVAERMPKKDLKSRELHQNEDFLNTLIHTLEQGNETFSFLIGEEKEEYQIEVFNTVSDIPDISEDILAFELNIQNSCIKLKHLKEFKTSSNEDQKMNKKQDKEKKGAESPRIEEETMQIINLKEIVALPTVEQAEAVLPTDDVISESNEKIMIGFLGNEQSEMLTNLSHENVQIESSDIAEALKIMTNNNRDQAGDIFIVNNDEQKEIPTILDDISNPFAVTTERNGNEEYIISREISSLKNNLVDSQVNIDIKNAENRLLSKLETVRNTSENIVIHITIPVKSELAVVLHRGDGELQENINIPIQVRKEENADEQNYTQDINELPVYNPTPTINSVIDEEKPKKEVLNEEKVESTVNEEITTGRVKKLIDFFEHICDDQ